MLQVVSSSSVKSKGNYLKVECAVLPEDNKVEAIPDEATAIAI